MADVRRLFEDVLLAKGVLDVNQIRGSVDELNRNMSKQIAEQRQELYSRELSKFNEELEQDADISVMGEIIRIDKQLTFFESKIFGGSNQLVFDTLRTLKMTTYPFARAEEKFPELSEILRIPALLLDAHETFLMKSILSPKDDESRLIAIKCSFILLRLFVYNLWNTKKEEVRKKIRASIEQICINIKDVYSSITNKEQFATSRIFPKSWLLECSDDAIISQKYSYSLQQDIIETRVNILDDILICSYLFAFIVNYSVSNTSNSEKWFKNYLEHVANLRYKRVPYYGSIKDYKKSLSSDNKSCFIATAAYGSPFDYQVELFRLYRDAYLLKRNWGKLLVNIYYKISPPIAKVVSKSKKVRSITRELLDAILIMIYK